MEIKKFGNPNHASAWESDVLETIYTTAQDQADKLAKYLKDHCNG